jgi:hypothetical protein
VDLYARRAAWIPKFYDGYDETDDGKVMRIEEKFSSALGGGIIGDLGDAYRRGFI